MAFVIGDADHLLGAPIIGKPLEGQSYVYREQAFVPETFVERSQADVLNQSVLCANQAAEQAFNKSMETQIFLQRILSENRLEIHPLEKVALESLRQNSHLLWLQNGKRYTDLAGSIVDGFVDSFMADDFIDWSLSQAFYDQGSGSFSPIEPIPGQNRMLWLKNAGDAEVQNVQGKALYWFQDNFEKGHFEGSEHLFSPGSVVDKGEGMVGLPLENHGLSAGQLVRLYGFTNHVYNSIHVVDIATTAHEIVIRCNHVPEQIVSGCAYRLVTPVDAAETPSIEAGMVVEFHDSSHKLVWIDTDTKGVGAQKVALDAPVHSQAVKSIKGILIGPEGLEVSSGRDYAGERNNSTTDAIPASSNSQRVASSSQTEGYEAYKVFDNSYGIDNRWLSARYDNSGWITYDFGVDTKVINKYRWRTFENDSDAVPGAWKLEGSNDNLNWVLLHEGANSVTTANTWIPNDGTGYFCFFNNQAYRYYRFNVTENCGHPEFLCIDEIELIEAGSPVYGQSLMIARTKPEFIPDAGSWGSLEHVRITERKPGSSKIFCAVSFDGGEAWSVFKNGEWKKIAVCDSGAWKFLDSSQQWRASAANDVSEALKAAFSIASNGMTAREIGDISLHDWSGEGGWSQLSNSVQFAFGLMADADQTPGVEGIQITYTSESKPLQLLSFPIPIDPTAKFLNVSFLIKNYHESLGLYISMDDQPWIRLENLRKRASVANGKDFYVADELSIHEGSQIRIKAECESRHGLELHGWALSWH